MYFTRVLALKPQLKKKKPQKYRLSNFLLSQNSVVMTYIFFIRKVNYEGQASKTLV